MCTLRKRDGHRAPRRRDAALRRDLRRRRARARRVDQSTPQRRRCRPRHARDERRAARRAPALSNRRLGAPRRRRGVAAVRHARQQFAPALRLLEARALAPALRRRRVRGRGRDRARPRRCALRLPRVPLRGAAPRGVAQQRRFSRAAGCARLRGHARPGGRAAELHGRRPGLLEQLLRQLRRVPGLRRRRRRRGPMSPPAKHLERRLAPALGPRRRRRAQHPPLLARPGEDPRGNHFFDESDRFSSETGAFRARGSVLEQS